MKKGFNITKKRSKATKPKAVQDIRFKGYYPEVNIIEIKSGVYLKLYEVTDNGLVEDRELYEVCLDARLGGQGRCQFFHHKGKSYQVVRVKADIVDDAVKEFDEILNKFNENQAFDYQEVGLQEWFDIICDFTREEDFQGQIGVVKVSAKNAMQPLERKVTADALELGERISKTAILTSFPSAFFTGFMTELLCISDKISTSVYVDEINIEHCQKALDTVTDMYEVKKHVLQGYMEKLQKREEKLYSTCVLVHVDGLVGEVERLYTRIEELCKNYLVGVNPLEQQQLQGFLSMLPLDDNLIRVSRGVSGSNVRCLQDFSWMKRLHSGYCYGISEVSGKELYFNRKMDRGSGFYLGSKAKQEIRAEINWLRETERIAVFTLGQANKQSESFCGLSGNKVLCEDAKINREILRAVFYIKNGNNGNISERLKGLLNKVLMDDANVMDYESFLMALSAVNSDIERKMRDMPLVLQMEAEGEVEQSGQMGVYKPLATSKTEQFIQLMGAIANCKENIIYVLDGDVFAGIKDNRFLMEIMRQTGKMVTCMGTDDMAMLRNAVFKDMMRESDFVHISTCETLEKINVAAVLELSKSQRIHIQDEKHSLLMTRYADYLVRKEEEEEDEQGT